MKTIILTDAQGRPFERPCREDFATDLDFLSALYAYKDRVAGCANESFSSSFSSTIQEAAVKGES